MGDFRKPRVAEYGMYGRGLYTWMYGHGAVYMDVRV